LHVHAKRQHAQSGQTNSGPCKLKEVLLESVL
jgi:hypothetical protein